MNINSTQKTQSINASHVSNGAQHNKSFNINDIMVELAKLNGSWRDAQQNMGIEQRHNHWDAQVRSIDKQVDINHKNKKASMIRGAFGVVGSVVGFGTMAKPMLSNLKNNHLSKFEFSKDKLISKRLFNNENLGDIHSALSKAKNGIPQQTLETFQNNVQQELSSFKPTKSQADSCYGMRRSHELRRQDFAADKARVADIVSGEQAKLKTILESSSPESMHHIDSMCASIRSDLDTVVDNAQQKIFRGKEGSPALAAMSQGFSQLSTAGGEFWATGVEMDAKSGGISLEMTKELGSQQQADSQRLLDGARETSRQMRDVLSAMNSIYERITSAVH